MDYYSGVVELETVRIHFVIAANAALAYFQALIDELVHAVAGQDFDHCQGVV